MITYIVFDSNALRVGDKQMEFGHFATHNRLSNLINKIEKNDLSENYKVIIPKIVVEELKKQQMENFKTSYNELKNIYKKMEKLYFLDLNEIVEINYSNKVEELINQFLSNNNINILEICEENKFANIVNRALEKKAPFRGTSGNSDKGFKDALIWESLLEFGQSNKGNFIYITKDGDFLKRQKELKFEFSDSTKNSITFMEAEKLEETPNMIDKVINNKEELLRVKCVEEEFISIKEEIFEELESTCFQSVVVSGNDFTKVNIIFHDSYFFSEINDSLFQVIVPSKAILDDAGIHYELDLKIKFELSVDGGINKIKLVEVIAKLLNGKVLEDFSIGEFEKEYDILDELEEEEFTEDKDKDVIPSSPEKHGAYLSGVLDKEKVTLILEEYDENILSTSEEIMNIIEESATIDWYLMANRESLVKTELKKMFRKNKENIQIIDSLANKLIYYAKQSYENYTLDI